MPVTQDQIDRAVEIARRYGATRVLLFGSAVDHPETARDLDLAVGGVDGWEFLRMSAEIERTVMVPLDVVPLDAESWFTNRINERGQVLYERP